MITYSTDFLHFVNQSLNFGKLTATSTGRLTSFTDAQPSPPTANVPNISSVFTRRWSPLFSANGISNFTTDGVGFEPTVRY